MSLSSAFVARLRGMSVQDLPGEVVAKAQTCLLDYLGVAYAGSHFYEDRISRFLSENALSGSARILNWKETADLSTAVMVNAFHAHVLELDDSHRVALTHLGASIFSALIGVAEARGCTIGQLLKGAVVGYEAAVRIGNAVQPSHKKRGFHSSGTCCTVGCAMGIAAMLGYSDEEMNNVFSAAVTSAAGLLEIIGDYSEQKPYNVANAAVAGLNAALLGKYFRGAEDILDGGRGFLKAFSDEYDSRKLFDDGYAIETIYQKCFASCRHCHTPMEAVLEVRSGSGRPAAEISDIEVQTYDLAVFRHDHTDITGVSSAKQSIPYSVAAAYCFGDGGLDAYSETAVRNPEVLALTKKVRLVENPELSRLVPGKRAAIVTVTYQDGEKMTRRVDYAKGEPENPFSTEEILAKYDSLMSLSGVSPAERAGMKERVMHHPEMLVRNLFNQ